LWNDVNQSRRDFLTTGWPDDIYTYADPSIAEAPSSNSNPILTDAAQHIGMDVQTDIADIVNVLPGNEHYWSEGGQYKKGNGYTFVSILSA
jgi:hypothetical protein